MKFLALLLVWGMIAAAQERPKPSPEIQALVDAAGATPPELAADVLLTLAESGKIPSREQRLELIEQAFQLAGQAKFATPQVGSVFWAFHTDSSPGIRNVSLDSGLSTLGLRSRAVRATLALDKPKAIALFRQITVGSFSPLTCADALVPSFGDYYQTLSEVASTAYSPAEKKDGRHLEFVEAAVRSMSIPQQQEPVAKLLATFPLTAAQKAELASAYAGILKQMNADPRSFGAALASSGQAASSLAASLQSSGIPTAALVSAYRAYLAGHLQGEVCAETADPKEGGRAIRQVVETVFNEELLKRSGVTDIAPLDVNELKPKSVGGRAQFSDYWLEGRSWEMMAKHKALRFGTKEQQEEYAKLGPREDRMARFLPEDVRRTPEWEAKAREFLNDLERWSKNHDEAEVDFFHEMCIQYKGLLIIIPSGSFYDRVLDSYLSFLKTSSLERESPPEWLLHVRDLFSLTDTTAEQKEHVRAAVQKNGDLVMSLYAELDRLGLTQKRR